MPMCKVCVGSVDSPIDYPEIETEHLFEMLYSISVILTEFADDRIYDYISNVYKAKYKSEKFDEAMRLLNTHVYGDNYMTSVVQLCCPYFCYDEKKRYLCLYVMMTL